MDPKKSGYPKQDSVAPRNHSRYPEHFLGTEGGRSRYADPYPEHLPPPRGKHEDGYPEFEHARTGRAREEGGRDAERAVKRKERPARPPPPKFPAERDEDWSRERQTPDRGRDNRVEKDYRRDVEQDLRPVRDGEKSRDRVASGDRHGERDRQRQKATDRSRGRSGDRALEEDFLDQGRRRDRPRDTGEEEEEVDGERRARSRQRVHSNPVQVFDGYMNDKERGGGRETWDPQQGGGSHTYTNKETGTTPSPSSWLCGGVCVVCCFLQVVGFNQNENVSDGLKNLGALVLRGFPLSCDVCRAAAARTTTLC